jgi:hypothetical protein
MTAATVATSYDPIRGKPVGNQEPHPAHQQLALANFQREKVEFRTYPKTISRTTLAGR